MTRRAGTTRWSATEVLKSGHYTEKEAVDSYAITSWEMLVGKGEMPFSKNKFSGNF